MTAQLVLGTYRCQAIPEAAACAAASGAQWIDTAPNYATGQVQTLLAARPHVRIATKTGFFTAATGADAVNDVVLTEDQAAAHSLPARDPLGRRAGLSTRLSGVGLARVALQAARGVGVKDPQQPYLAGPPRLRPAVDAFVAFGYDDSEFSAPAAKLLATLPEHVEDMVWDVLDAAAGDLWGFRQGNAEDPEGEDVRHASVGRLSLTS
ncbi:hypothetical protein P9869_39280 [Streptomyces ossamyceticus]|nr:hypothetical protein [Streptomyces ossamyceticus]